jgi:hypothetical protein
MLFLPSFLTNNALGIGRSSLSITLRMLISTSTPWLRICSRSIRPESGCRLLIRRRLLAQAWDFKPLAESAQVQLARTDKPRSREDHSSRPSKTSLISIPWAKVHEDIRPELLMLFNLPLISPACPQLRFSSRSLTAIRHSPQLHVTVQAIMPQI